MIVLGIETSCDETAASICSSGKILSSVISSQYIHQKFGGVVPELASREHERLLYSIVNNAIKDGGISIDMIEGVAVTQGPGLSGTLLTGISFAKGLALGKSLPIIGINHLEAHIYANFLADPELEYPFICLLVSGGHTQIWYIKGMNQYSLLGETRDDAAGEAFDKGARILGLKYPGGPEIEKAAQKGNPSKIKFPRSFINNDNLEFSFSGLKTSLLYFMDTFTPNQKVSFADVTASYQMAIIDVLTAKLAQAVKHTNVKTCLVAGGVAANQVLRNVIKKRISGSVRVIFPDLSYCTDNAAMIAFLGELKLESGERSRFDFNVQPNLKLN